MGSFLPVRDSVVVIDLLNDLVIDAVIDLAIDVVMISGPSPV